MEKQTGSDLSRKILKNPAWFPVSFDWGQGTFGFTKTSRERLSALSFLDGREDIGPASKATVSISEILNETPRPETPLFIFHTGFCCSTLVARCLDKDGKCLTVKEPGILNAFSNLKPVLDSDFLKARFYKTVGAGFHLLGRRFTNGETVLIKASNFDTPLIPDVRKIFPEARFLLIHQDLKSFLISVAKGGEPRRRFVRDLWDHYLRISENDRTYPLLALGKTPSGGLTDLHFAALAWIWQMSLFKIFEGENTKTLECDSFLENPEKALKGVCSFLGFSAGPGREQIKKEMARHAKAPEFSFTPEKRSQEMRTLEAYLKPLLPGILEWAGEIMPPGEKNLPIKLAV